MHQNVFQGAICEIPASSLLLHPSALALLPKRLPALYLLGVRRLQHRVDVEIPLVSHPGSAGAGV